MTKGYNDGKWHGWNGGECPVHPETIVNIKFSCGTECNTYGAGGWDWGDTPTNIVAFRVVKQCTEPREWWILHGKIYDYDCDPSAIHVREVLD